MKKLALTSLLAFMAVSGAHAANVIDGNPLYMPKAGHFYSETTLATHSEPGRVWALGEDFGYGISDKLAVDVSTAFGEQDAFDTYSWSNLALGLTFRAIDDASMKLDVVGSYVAGSPVDSTLAALVPGALMYHVPGTTEWFDKDATSYTWTLGVRGGFVGSNWTVAAHALFNYWNTESFKWGADAGEQGFHTIALGLDGQFVIDPHWNLVAGVEYVGVLDKEAFGIPGATIENAGKWSGEFGVNYNIDATKYVGVYVNGVMDHWKGDGIMAGTEKGWGFEKGFGFGAKFGIDF